MRPGAKFSTRTSARSTIRKKSARPSGCLRSIVTLRLLALKTRKNISSSPGTSGRLRRDCSPPGGSILSTSAPSQPRNCVHVVPASNWVRSRMRIPWSARSAMALTLRRVGGEAHGLRARLVVGDDVHHRRLAGGERALERRPDLVRLLDELAVRAQLLGYAVVAGVAEIAAGLGQRPCPRRIGRPATVVADHDHEGNLVADGRVDLHRVDAVGP